MNIFRLGLICGVALCCSISSLAAQTGVYTLGYSQVQIEPHFCTNRLFTSKSVQLLALSSPLLPNGGTSTRTETFHVFNKVLKNFTRTVTETTSGTDTLTLTKLSYRIALTDLEKTMLADDFGILDKMATPFYPSNETCEVLLDITLRSKPTLGHLPSVVLQCSWEGTGGQAPGPVAVKRETLPRDRFHIVSRCG